MEVNFFIAFIFGFLSFVSPCVLPLVPGYLAIFSESEDDIKTRLFGSVQFTLGFSLVFISLAAIATNIGSFFSRNSESLSRVSGLIIIFFGLVLIIPSLNNRYFYSTQYLQPRSKKYYKLGEIKKCQICKTKGETYKIFDGDSHIMMGGKNSYYNVCFSCANNLDHEIYI
jgi:cytochrome c biogenesis protein CcdA